MRRLRTLGLRLRHRLRKQVRVHMVEREQSIEGILLGRVAGHYRIANAILVGETQRYALDGEQWIPYERVLYVQVLG